MDPVRTVGSHSAELRIPLVGIQVEEDIHIRKRREAAGNHLEDSRSSMVAELAVAAVVAAAEAVLVVGLP